MRRRDDAAGAVFLVRLAGNPPAQRALGELNQGARSIYSETPLYGSRGFSVRVRRSPCSLLSLPVNEPGCTSGIDGQCVGRRCPERA